MCFFTHQRVTLYDMQIYRVKSVGELHQLVGLEKPRHPLLTQKGKCSGESVSHRGPATCFCVRKRCIRCAKNSVREPSTPVGYPERAVREGKRSVREPKRIVREGKRFVREGKKSVPTRREGRGVPGDACTFCRAAGVFLNNARFQDQSRNG